MLWGRIHRVLAMPTSALALSTVLALAGCETDTCDGAADAAAADASGCLIKLDQAKVTPAAGSVAFDPTVDTLKSFAVDASAGLGTCTDAEVLHYAWYLDEDPGSNLPPMLFARCGDTTSCSLAPCSAPHANATLTLTLTLKLVVSHKRLPVDAKNSTDFGAGADFDTVSWTINLSQSCPQ